MKTRYRLRKKTVFDGTLWIIEKEKKPDYWWPVACYSIEQEALEAFEIIKPEEEDILKEKEV